MIIVFLSIVASRGGNRIENILQYLLHRLSTMR